MRDTQVGLKVFSRRVVEEVVPLLLVKRFAFDLELLAVATALGRGRIQELPVRLEYRFSGSALRSSAVVRALWDTAAIFYRLRILRTYQRKRGLVGGPAGRSEWQPLVSVIGDHAAVEALDYPRLESASRPRLRQPGELLAVLGPRARPAGNWIARGGPVLRATGGRGRRGSDGRAAPGTLRESAAAAVLESRLGGGSRRSRHFPGNVRTVSDYPAENFIVRREDYAAALDEAVDDEHLVAWLAQRGRKTVYTPDTSISEVPAPLFSSHLRGTWRHACARGAAARRSRGVQP